MKQTKKKIRKNKKKENEKYRQKTLWPYWATTQQLQCIFKD